MSVVIIRDEWGVYLGSCMGMGFWTLLDPAGQDQACIFESPVDAIDYILTWDENNDPADYSFIRVVPTYKHYATISDLKRAGLGSLLGNMESEALEYGEPVGSA